MGLYCQDNLQHSVDPRRIFSRLLRRFFMNKEEQADVERNTDCDRIDLLKSIEAIHSEWEQVNKDFEYAGDEASVDYYTYKIKACEIRYQHFLREAKEKGVNMRLGVR